jgi:hypothetical protein
LTVVTCRYSKDAHLAGGGTSQNIKQQNPIDHG